MTVPPYVLVIVLIIFGFLSGATLYFYDQSRTVVVSHSTGKTVAFTGQIPANQPTTQDQALRQFTKPDAPNGRLSYPTNIYTVVANDTLFSIGQKFGLTWQLIMQANGLTNENVIQADYPLVVPALDPDTDYYRVNFTLNNDVATALNVQLRAQPSSDYFDPIKVAQMDALPYFGTTAQDSFTLGVEDLSKGTAVVQVKNGGNLSVVVGLFQPKVKGAKGLWAVLYVEQQTVSS